MERRFGWDCHGLPAEMETEKELGVWRPSINDTASTLQRGVPHVSDPLHRGVGRDVTRQARWVDFENDYKTMDLLHGVGHVGVQATLGQGSGLRSPPSHAVLVGRRDAAVQLRDPTRRCNSPPPGSGDHRRVPASSPSCPATHRAKFFLAWTTTPWTLPSNLALAVGPDLDLLHHGPGRPYGPPARGRGRAIRKGAGGWRDQRHVKDAVSRTGPTPTLPLLRRRLNPSGSSSPLSSKPKTARASCTPLPASVRRIRGRRGQRHRHRCPGRRHGKFHRGSRRLRRPQRARGQQRRHPTT